MIWTHSAFLFLSFRNHLQLGGHLHPPHQQRLEPHPLHPDHQLLQRTGGALTLSLAEETHLEKRPQKPHILHHLHRAGHVLPEAGLPPAGVTDWCRPSLRLREEGALPVNYESGDFECSILRLLHASGTRSTSTELRLYALTCFHISKDDDNLTLLSKAVFFLSYTHTET